MQVLLVRHAIAMDRAEWARTGRPDKERPLIEKGIARMEQGALGLQTVIGSLDLICTSPLVRAYQTAEILKSAFASAYFETLLTLAPGGSALAIVERLAEQEASCCCLVGHEPDLSELLVAMCSNDGSIKIEFKKGAAALIEFPGDPELGHGNLRWLLPPRVLRALGQS